LNVIPSRQGTVESRHPVSLSKKHWTILASKRPWTIFAAIFLVEVLQSSTSLAGFPGPWRYYAYQWTVSYANGFTRRGLLGSVLGLLRLDNGNYLLIAVCGWLITLALFWLVARVLMRLLAPLRPMTRNVLLITLLLSPVTTGLLVQATGDPIQLILLVYIALTLFVLKPGSSVTLSTLTFVVFGAATILVHEASLFFIGPALLLAAFSVRRSVIDRSALLGYILGAAPTLLLTIHFTENHTAAAIAPMHFGSTQMVATSKITLDTFSSLLAEENAAHFHNGIRGYMLTVRNAVGTLLLPLFFAVVVSHLLPQSLGGAVASRRRGIFAFALPLILSAPLWMIAHDWGRFSSYLFILTLTVLSLKSTGLTMPNAAQQARELPSFIMGTLLVLSGLTTTRILTSYILKGVGDDIPTMIATLLLCSVIVWSLPGPTRAPSD
jgi:hypothetical protein